MLHKCHMFVSGFGMCYTIIYDIKRSSANKSHYFFDLSLTVLIRILVVMDVKNDFFRT